MKSILWAIVIVVTALAASEIDTAKKVKVFILAGQSNMEGKAKLELLNYQINASETKDFFAHLHKDGKYIERDDVWINFLDRHGKLTPGFGSPGCIGPELEFGNVVGDAFNEQVLLIKTAWGGKSLGRDFRSPSSGFPSDEYLKKKLDEANKRIQEQNAKNPNKKQPETTLDEMKAGYGKFYRDMLAEIKTVVGDLPKRFPEYKNQGYEIAGCAWFQGWNDLFDAEFYDHYEENMANFIKDLRKDLGVPNMPFVIGQMGQDGTEAKGTIVKIKAAQAAAAERPEFKGNVKCVKTDIFWDKKAAALVDKWKEHLDEWKKVGSDYGYHYLGSAITYSKIGRAMGEAMLELMQGK